MIVVFAFVVALLFVLVVARILRRRRNAHAAVRPLAGVDTGFRSSFSGPGRFFNHRRGF